MALFKPFRGNSADLNAVEKHDGYAYFCTDTGEFFIDYADSNGELHRKQINADEAKKLTGYDITNALNDSEVEIPTSKAILDALNLKQDVITGTEGQYVGFDSDGNTAAFDLPSEVIISDTEPTDETAEIWINTSEEWNDNLPEQVQADLNQTDETAPDYVKGTVDHTRLPEGYPYKEGEKHEIVWDGNTAGLVSVPIAALGGTFYKVSDATPGIADLIGGKYTVTTTGEKEIAETDLMEDGGIIMPMTPEFVVVLSDGASVSDFVFPEAGVYFIGSGDYYVSNLTYGNETIHPIAPEFLPEGYPYKEMGKTEFAILGEVEFGEYVDTNAQANAFVNEEIVVGETYAVVLDGKEYVATAYERTTSSGLTLKMIGNASQEDGTFDENGPPFYCTTMKYGEQVMLIININAEAGTHTVEIYKFVETIHTMAPEFLPAGVGGVQVVRGDIDASTGLITFGLTGNEIAELAKTSSVAVEIYYGDTLTQTLYLSCLVGGGAMANPVFIGASHNTSSITLSVISIPATSKNAPAISATLNADA